MIQTNRIFEVSQALEIDYYGSFIIPFTFSQEQRQLIVTITNASNYNQQKMGEIIPFTEYGIGGQLDYFQKSIYAGNNYLETSAIDDYKLKFKPYKNGNYFITIDEIIDSDFELMKANLLAPISQGRLTLTSNTPVLTASTTGATTLYYTPYTGNQISIWDGSKWFLRTFTQLSLSLSGLPANTNYDVFIYDNAGTLTLEAVAWSNSGAGTSARASAISFLNGVYVKTSDSRKYLGSFRTTATIGETCFQYGAVGANPARFFVFNEYNRVKRNATANVYTGTHSYTTSTWRQRLDSPDYGVQCIFPYLELTLYSTNQTNGFISLGINGNVSGSTRFGIHTAGISGECSYSLVSGVYAGYNLYNVWEFGYTGNSFSYTYLVANYDF